MRADLEGCDYLYVPVFSLLGLVLPGYGGALFGSGRWFGGRRYRMPPEASLKTLESLVRAGINYVCAGCGALLYHNGPDGASEGGEAGFASRQPWEVVERLKSCPNCGRTLNPDPAPDAIRLQAVEESQEFSS